MTEIKEVVSDGAPKAVDYHEYGSTGLNRWGNNVADEFLVHLQYPRAAEIYKEMADNDPTIGAILYMSEQLVRNIRWSVPSLTESDADKEAAAFLESCLHDMSQSWETTIAEILSMFTYGFSFHEIVYKQRLGPNASSGRTRSKYDDGRIGWARIPGRSQHTLFGWEFANDGGIKAFKQQAPPNYKMVDIPLNKGLLFRTRQFRDNPEGRSLLRNAYRPWYFKKRIEEIEGIGIERDLAGLPVIIPPEDANIWDPMNKESIRLKGVAESLVRNIRRDRSEGVVLPFGWELKLLSTGGSRQFDTNAIINRYDNRIAITMLADIVMMGGDKAGSFALGEVKKGLLAASLESAVAHIADVFNSYAVPKLFQYNYFPGITGIPKLVPEDVETPSLKDIAFLLRAGGLNAAKDIQLMNLLRSLISLDPLAVEEFDEIYKNAVEAEEQSKSQPSGGGYDPDDPTKDSQNTDPLGHKMDDANQNYEGR